MHVPVATVWPGALFTAVLFMLGKYLLGIYITDFNIDSNYGSAGACVTVNLGILFFADYFFAQSLPTPWLPNTGNLLDARR